jgi:hypothetical protein
VTLEQATVLIGIYWARTTTSLAEALEMLGEARDLAEEMGDVEGRAEATQWRVSALMALGEIAPAREELAIASPPLRLLACNRPDRDLVGTIGSGWPQASLLLTPFVGSHPRPFFSSLPFLLQAGDDPVEAVLLDTHLRRQLAARLSTRPDRARHRERGGRLGYQGPTPPFAAV